MHRKKTLLCCFGLFWCFLSFILLTDFQVTYWSTTVYKDGYHQSDSHPFQCDPEEQSGRQRQLKDYCRRQNESISQVILMFYYTTEFKTYMVEGKLIQTK